MAKRSKKVNRRSTSLWLAVLLGATLVLCGGYALAQHDDAHDAHGEEAHSEAEHVDAEHAEAGEHGEAAHGDAEHAAAGGHDDHSSIPHLTNIIGYATMIMVDDDGHPTAAANFLRDYTDPIFSLFVVAMLAIFFARVHANLDPRNPTRLQVAVEMILGGLYNIFENVIGTTARRYTPYLGTLFLFILVNNLVGLVPLSHSSTSSFAHTTFALGLCTFFYVQGVALKENGILGYLHHMAGSPKTGLDWGFSILLFPLHLIGELIKPISLSLRLFGNIFGEDTLIATMTILGTMLVYSILGQDWLPGIPFQLPFYFLGMLTCTIQALVFTLLSTVYIALMLPHDEHHAEEAPGH